MSNSTTSNLINLAYDNMYINMHSKTGSLDESLPIAEAIGAGMTERTSLIVENIAAKAVIFWSYGIKDLEDKKTEVYKTDVFIIFNKLGQFIISYSFFGICLLISYNIKLNITFIYVCIAGVLYKLLVD
jgi:hypothetical protein